MKLSHFGQTLSALALFISSGVAHAQSPPRPVKNPAGLNQAMARAVRGFDKNAAGEYFASQPGMNYLAKFSPAGNVTLSADKTQFGVGVTAFGFGANRGLLGSTTPGLGKDKDGWPTLTLSRPTLSEKYVNGESGLHHWFSVASRPNTAGNLWIRLGVTGDAKLKSINDSAVEVRGKSRVFTYAGLKAWDATGKALPARLEVAQSNVNILVQDAGAKYPVIVDPVWIMTQMLVPLNPTGPVDAQFGRTLSQDGNLIAIGHTGETVAGLKYSGAVYIFERQTDNSWQLKQRVVAKEPHAGDSFGYAVAVSGDRMIVGAPFRDSDGVTFFFKRGTDGSWTQTDTAHYTGNRIWNILFGARVAIDGDNALVGNPGPQEAFFFHRNGDDTWTLTSYVPSPDDFLYADHFGEAISISGDYAVIGASYRFWPDLRATNGAAHVYHRGADGTWKWQAMLANSDQYFDDRFGIAVSIKGHRILVGSRKAYTSGAAYIFDQNSDGTWTQTAKITPSDASTSVAYFGSQLSFDGYRAIIAAYPSGNLIDGIAYIFQLNTDGTWIEKTKIQAPGGPSPVYSGNPVSILGDTALVSRLGANGYGGLVYVFTLQSQLGLNVLPAPITSFSSATGTVQLVDPAPAGGVTFTLSSSSPRVSVPATVSVLAGQTIGTFPVTAGAITDTETARITAIGGGFTPPFTDVTLIPGSLSLAVKDAPSGSGYSYIGTVSLTAPAPTGGLSINLSCDLPVLSVPSTLTVPEGQKSATFPIAAGNVFADTLATITATNSFFFSASFGITLHPLEQNSEFVSQTVLDQYYTGRSYPVSITMRNMGSSTWTSTTHQLVSVNPLSNNTWGPTLVKLPAGTTVVPGGSYTFKFNIKPPAVPGTYNFQWQMQRVLPKPPVTFGALTPNVSIKVLAGDDAEFVSQSVARTLEPGKTAAVQVVMKNAGSTNWSFDQVRLVSKSTPENLFGTQSVSLLPADNIAPTKLKTFTFNIQAPSTEGDYVFKWRLTRPGTGDFGPETPPISIHVQAANNSQFVSQSVPSSMKIRTANPVTVTFKNTGTATWKPGTYYLYSQNTVGNLTWKVNKIALTGNVAPGQSATFSFKATAPAIAGTYNFQWRLSAKTGGDFGEFSPNVVVNVTN